MCIYCITPLAKGLCDTPLVSLTLKFHNIHPFLIHTPTPSVYAHPIFNCALSYNVTIGAVETLHKRGRHSLCVEYNSQERHKNTSL